MFDLTHGDDLRDYNIERSDATVIEDSQVEVHTDAENIENAEPQATSTNVNVRPYVGVICI